MNTSKLIAALTIFAAAGGAWAEEAAVSKVEAAEAATSSVSYPSALAKPALRTRAEVRAEAVEAVKNHQSTLSKQLDLGT